MADLPRCGGHQGGVLRLHGWQVARWATKHLQTGCNAGELAWILHKKTLGGCGQLRSGQLREGQEVCLSKVDHSELERGLALSSALVESHCCASS